MTTTTAPHPDPRALVPDRSPAAGTGVAPDRWPAASAGDAQEPSWITATVRPTGSFGRADVGRLRALLDALAACASIVVLDLQAARLRSPRAGAAIDEAAVRLEGHGGCLVCLNVDDASRAYLSGSHAVVLAAS